MWSRGGSLTARFAVSTLVVFVAVGALLTVLVVGQLRRSEEAAAEGHAVYVTDAIMANALTAEDLKKPVTGSEYRRLLALVRGRVLSIQFPVVRVKVWRYDGTVVFSDASKLVGKRFERDADLVTAFGGAATSGIADLSDRENVYERSLADKLLATYVPLYLDHGSRSPNPSKRRPPDAVVELYTDYAGIQRGLDSLTRWFVFGLLGGLLVLYLLMLPLSRRASRTLRLQNAKLGEQARSLEDQAKSREEQAASLAQLLKKEQRAVTELEEVNRRKDEFVANVSHELRTPLTAIIGYADTLARENGDLDPAIRHEFATGTLRQAKRLRDVVENLLAASTADRGAELSIETFGPDEALRTVVDGLGPGSGRVQARVAKDVPNLVTDRTAYQQVVSNLLANALKFSSSDVEVSLWALGPWLVTEVTDHGIGIDPEDRDRIFERFYQVDSSSTRSQGGLGLGLSIAQDLVRMLGGEIEVRSQPGSGSTFTFRVPAIHPMAPGAAAAPLGPGSGSISAAADAARLASVSDP